MRLLVLGSGGRIGRLLRASWPQSSELDVTWHGGSADGFDILNEPTALRQALTQCDKTLMLAGVTTAQPDRPFSTNSALAHAVLTAADGKPVYLASTAAVYGRHPGPLTEDVAQPISGYGRSKHAMEQLAEAYPTATCLRIGNVAGADALLGAPQPDQVLHQFPNGGFPSRSYVGPATLAQALARLVELDDLPPILNVAGPDVVSMADLLDAAGGPWRAVPAPADAIETVRLDTSKLARLMPPLPCDIGSVIAELRRFEGAL